MMNHSDTAELLRECDAGTKMAVSSLDEVLEGVEDSSLKRLLQESREHHKQIEQEIHSCLRRNASQEKEPNPIAKGMSWMKINFKLGTDHSDAMVADLITDGCNMGVKSLSQYLNQYKAADDASKNICTRLISIEEELGKNLRRYL